MFLANKANSVPIADLVAAVLCMQRLELVDDVLRGGQPAVAPGVVRETIAQVLPNASRKRS